MNLKELIFGGGVKSGGDGGTYRDSIQAWLPIKNIIGGVVITKDGRFVKILELLPVNIYLKSPNDRQNIISSFAAYLKIAPNDLQMVARTLPADTQAYVEQMQRYAEKEDNEACREMIEDNIQEIGNGIASDAMRHRFFLVFQYEASMRAKRNTVASIIQRLNEEADTARRYPDVVNVDQLREMLGGIGYKAAYGLLHDGSIRFFKIGKAFRIPKINIIEYLQRNSEI